MGDAILLSIRARSLRSGTMSITSTSQGVQAWDRYAYTNNSPVNFTDPTGHIEVEGDGGTSFIHPKPDTKKEKTIDGADASTSKRYKVRSNNTSQYPPIYDYHPKANSRDTLLGTS